MTAIVKILRRDRAIFVSDAACIDQDRKLRATASKIALVPGGEAMIVGRGNIALPHALGGVATGEGWDFDTILRKLPAMAPSFMQYLPIKNANDEIAVAGYSSCRDAFEIHHMPCYDADGVEAFALYPQAEPIIAAPQPSPAGAAAAGFICPELDEFDPDADGVRLIKAMRATPEWSHSIGGFIQIAEVSREGLTSRIVHRWSDAIGEVII